MAGLTWASCGMGMHFHCLPVYRIPQNEVQDAMIAQCALRAPLGHRKVRQEKCGELRFGELDGDWRRCGLCCRYAHHARTSCQGYGCASGNQVAPYTTRG